MKTNRYVYMQYLLIILLISFPAITMSQTLKDEGQQEWLIKYGNNLENSPFEVRNDFYKETNSSWRYITFSERKKYFEKWLKKHPEFILKTKEKKEDPALLNDPTKLQKKYGIYLENAPVGARLEFVNSSDKSWNDIDYLQKKEFLEGWLKRIETSVEISEEDISENIKQVLTEIHRKYGKDLYNVPFDARVEYFQTYNQSWRKAGYIDRKNYILEWYERNEEKLRKFKEQLRLELAKKFEGELDSAKMMELEIPKSYGKELKDVPFEMKREYHTDVGSSWNDASFEMKEAYAKKWLIENKDVFEKEMARIKAIDDSKIKVFGLVESNKKEREDYRDEIKRREKEREKAAKKKKKEEEDRKKAFKKRVAAQKKKLDDLIKKRDRDNRNR